MLRLLICIPRVWCLLTADVDRAPAGRQRPSCAGLLTSGPRAVQHRVDLSGSIHGRQKRVFRAAAQRWEQVIVGDPQDNSK